MGHLRYECAEHGCDFVVVADESEIVTRVNEHISSEHHGSFELEEVVFANAMPADADGSEAVQEPDDPAGEVAHD